MYKLNIFNELSEHITLNINTSGEMTHPSSWKESKQHKDYDLWYIYEGQIEIYVQKEKYTATAGDLILFSPTVAYTAKALGRGCRFSFTHFDFILGNNQRILESFQLAGIIKSTDFQDEINIFLETYEQYKWNKPLSALRFKGSLMILIAKIIELYEIGQYRGEFLQSSSYPKQAMKIRSLQPVYHYIHNNLDQPLHVKELAQKAGMSEKYFIYYFKQAFGVTPGQYVYELKMNRAQKLLYDKQYSIQQIADKLGYADPYSFSKAFKRYYKVTPSQFV